MLRTLAMSEPTNSEVMQAIRALHTELNQVKQMVAGVIDPMT